MNRKKYLTENKKFIKTPSSCDDVLFFNAKYSAICEVEKWFTTVDLNMLNEIFSDDYVDQETIKTIFICMNKDRVLNVRAKWASDLPFRTYISADERIFERTLIAGHFYVLKHVFGWNIRDVKREFRDKRFLGFFIYKEIFYFDTEYVIQLKKFIKETQEMLLQLVDNKVKILKIVNENFVTSLKTIGTMIKNFTEKTSSQLDNMQKRVSSMEKVFEEERLKIKEQTRIYVDKEFGKFVEKQKKKGEEYIKKYEKRLKDKIPNYDGYLKMEKKVKKLYEETFCRICNTSSVNTVLNCGHMFCSQCTMLFRESEQNENKEIYPFGRCPICRIRIGVFISIIK